MAQIPDIVPIRVIGKGVNHARSDVKCVIGGFDMIIDEPVERGGTNMGPTPMDVLMAAFASCTHVIMNRIAGELGVELTDVDINAVGHLRTEAIVKKERLERPYDNVDLRVRCTSNGTPEQMEQLKEELSYRCPAALLFHASGANINEEWDVTYA